jgi:PAS domain S-box-containing protein
LTRIERFWPLVAALALVLAALAGATGAVSTHQGLALSVVAPLAGLAFVGAGLIGWVLRPDNGTGRLLVVIGFIFLVFSTLWAANDSVLYTTGNAFGSIYLATFAQLLLSYPAGRLRTRFERVAIVALYVIAGAAALLPTFFQAGKDASCRNCPANAFLIYDSKQTAHAINVVFSVAGLIVFASLFVVLALRWRRASAARRRVLAPVYASGGAAVAFLFVGFALKFVSSVVSDVFWAMSLVCFISLPFFFVGGLLRWRLHRAGVRMLLDSGEATPSEAEALLRRALGDPSLRLAYWVEDERCYIDLEGEELEPGCDCPGRLSAEISYEDRPLAAIEYDASLSFEPELLEEVLATARLTLEKDQRLHQLRLSEARSRALLRVLPDAMIRTNRAGVYLEVQGNRAGLVRPPEEMIGLTIRDTLPPDLVERILACIDRTLTTEEPQTLLYELDVQGELRSFEARMIPSSADEVVSVVRDVTEERRLREELTARLAELEREQRFTKTVVSTAPVMFLLLDPSGRITSFNRTCERLTGFESTEAVWGRTFWEVFVDPADHALAHEAIAAAADHAPLVEQELRWRTRSGEELVVATRCTPILDGQGRWKIQVSGLDLTERKLVLRELRASRARIVEAEDAERRRLERNLHDGAQQRLITLSLALRMAQARIASDPDGATSILENAAAELGAALAELRELARGLHPAVLADRGLDAALESLVDRAALPVELESDLEERLPAAHEVAAFYVVAEALTNVAKYASATRAWVRITRDDGVAVVEVGDDGCGGADASSGTGLRGLTDRLGALDGWLEIDSPPGCGTTVRARLPLPRARPPEVAADGHAPRPPLAVRR